MVAALSTGPSYWIAAGIVVASLGLLAAALQTRFKYLLVGRDNRTSTSKVQFALWTVALAYALLVIILHVGSYGNEALDPRYLLLLGFPAGAAVGAKAVTSGQVAAGSIGKVRAGGPSVADIVTDDQGNVSLGDSQYFIFNLVALTAFAVAFAHDPTKLPILPDTLIGLTSASAAAYVLNKAASVQPMSVNSVVPSIAAPGGTVHLAGSNLDGGNGGGQPDVYIDGQQATVIAYSPTSVSATVPPAVVPGAPAGPRAVAVDVRAPNGRSTSAPGKLTL